MNHTTEPPITLDWIRKISLRSLIGLTREQLLVLQFQAEKELFSAQLTKDWVDAAIRFQLWDEDEEVHYD